MTTVFMLDPKLLAPIAGAAPHGNDTKEHASAVRLREELGKLEALSGGEVDWTLVDRLGTELLTTTTKDLKIASQLAHAWLHTRGAHGVIAGIQLISDIADQYWEGVYPQRPKGRAAAISWFVERTHIVLGTRGLQAAENDALAQLDQAAQRLRAVAQQRLGDQAPAMQPLFETLERLRLNGAGASPHAATGTAANTASTDNPNAPAADVAAPAVPSASTTTTATATTTPSTNETSTSADASAPSSANAGDGPRVWARAWGAPISAEQPFGRDVKNDPLYLGIRDAMQMAEHPAGGAPNWPALVTRCDALLREHSKDLRTAAFRAFAGYKAEGIDALADGLAIIGLLIEDHWDGLYPSLERSTRARASALGWLLPRLEQLGAHPVSAADGPRVDRLAQAADYLVGQIHARFAPGDAPATGPLMEQVQRLKLSIPVDKPAPPVAAPTTQAPTASTAAAPTTQPAATIAAPATVQVTQAPPSRPEGGADVSQVRAYVRNLGRDLMAIADSLLDADPAAPEGYRLARFAAYAAINKNPPAQAGRLTVPSPEFVVGGLEKLLAAQEWSKLLVTAEKNARGNPFLLDAHRFAAIAMQRLGEPYDAARAVVIGELAGLLRRAPDLAGMSFSDGKPVAQPATRDWISQVVLPTGGGGDGGDGPEQQEISKARALAGEGKGKQAIEALDQLARSTLSGRVSFLARLSMAEVASGLKAHAVAEGLYAGLLQVADEHRLETWDPPLAIKLLSGYHRCLQTFGKDDRLMADRTRMIYGRLCRIDPVRAIASSD